MNAAVDRSNDVPPNARIGDPRLLLTAEQHIKVGEFAHRLQLGRRQYYASGKTDILARLNVSGVTEAKELFSRLGRKARAPWLAPRYLDKLPYIDPQTLVVAPPAHLFLRGILHSIIAFGVGKVKGWGLRKAGQAYS
jgi:hypothetical protein